LLINGKVTPWAVFRGRFQWPFSVAVITHVPMFTHKTTWLQHMFNSSTSTLSGFAFFFSKKRVAIHFAPETTGKKCRADHLKLRTMTTTEAARQPQSSPAVEGGRRKLSLYFALDKFPVLRVFMSISWLWREATIRNPHSKNQRSPKFSQLLGRQNCAETQYIHSFYSIPQLLLHVSNVFNVFQSEHI
jgi:hypothetical protein